MTMILIGYIIGVALSLTIGEIMTAASSPSEYYNSIGLALTWPFMLCILIGTIIRYSYEKATK